jgi:raffinose/stachyose/melibiose transport system substrate-binding protein
VESRHPEAARDFLEYLYQPDVIEEYNASQLGFAPTTDAPSPDDPRIEDMAEYFDEGRVYQGPSVLVPKTIPVNGYAQAMALGADPVATLRTMDADWARLAFRAPAPRTESKESAE